jgi:protein-L-isoaspartate(D-aspartate) O-methyltransferase
MRVPRCGKVELCAARPLYYGQITGLEGFMAEQMAREIERNTMVDCQVRPNNISDTRVTGAMRRLPREAFAPPGANAYCDADIPLGGGRYLFNPSLTARLAQLALDGNPAHALVVGAGAGYLAAILADAGVEVVALEEEARLDTGALARYAPAVDAVHGPLVAGWPANGPYDVIVIEGAVPAIPPIFGAQLATGGRVAAVLADDGVDGIGRLVLAEPVEAGYATRPICDCTARLLPQFRLVAAFRF